MKFGRLVIVLGFVALIVCTSCCPPKPIEVGYGHSLVAGGNMPAVEVHVIGFSSDASLNQFKNRSLNEYFDPSKPNSVRVDLVSTGMVKVLQFDAANAGQATPDSADPVQVIPVNDPIYANWVAKKVTTLVIIQNYPREVNGNPAAAQDPRYVEVPACADKWDGKALVIRILLSQPTVETPIKN